MKFISLALFLVYFTLLSSMVSMASVADALLIPDPVIHFGVGAVAGGVGAVAAYPFDYIKSQMQTEYGKETWGDDGLQAFKDTFQTQGPLQLYKGVGVQVMGIAPEKGIKLGVNDVLTAVFLNQYGVFPLWGQVVSGGVAGACQVVASSPLEVLKVGLQTSDRTLAEVWTEIGGFHGLFRGSGACIIRDVVFTAICFPLYNFCVQDVSMPTFFAGALAGVFSSFAATPPDVVKTRILSQRSVMPLALAIPTVAPQTVAVYSSLSEASEAVLDATAMTNSSTFEGTALAFQSNNDVSAAYYTNQQVLNEDQAMTDNPWTMFRRIIEIEGAGVLLCGSRERCIGAIPRFGTTLAMHDFLEQVAHQAGWLAQSIQ